MHDVQIVQVCCEYVDDVVIASKREISAQLSSIYTLETVWKLSDNSCSLRVLYYLWQMQRKFNIVKPLISMFSSVSTTLGCGGS